MIFLNISCALAVISFYSAFILIITAYFKKTKKKSLCLKYWALGFTISGTAFFFVWGMLRALTSLNII